MSTMESALDQGRRITAEEFVGSPREERCELIDGRVVPLSQPAPSHGLLAHQIALALGIHIKNHEDGGKVCGEAAFHLAARIDGGDTVRAPDAAYLDEEYLTAACAVEPTGSGEPSGADRRVPPPRFWPGGPTLAVEVMSPSDPWPKILAKGAHWLAAGSREVWIVAEASREVHALYCDRLTKVFGLPPEHTANTVTTELLPGFALPVADLFAVLD